MNRIRFVATDDIPRLGELQARRPDNAAWDTSGPDFAGGLAVTDEHDKPVVTVGAWRRAEVHCLVDESWGTPAMREQAFRELHDAMAEELKQRGVSEVYTFFADESEGILRRLTKLGWERINRVCLGRKL